MKSVAIVDYGNGNANSIKNALTQLGTNSIYSSRAEDIKNADSIILPGVGHHGAAMQSLIHSNLVEVLNEEVIKNRKPILGICLGMQLMTKSSEEGDSLGLGWINTVTRKIHPRNRIEFKVPHVGWNIVTEVEPSLLLQGLQTQDEPFYFCHAFAINDVEKPSVSSVFEYDKRYISHFEFGNIFGVQFHPEKSQESGLRVLQNFLSFGN